jgi:hypothetical protein
MAETVNLRSNGFAAPKRQQLERFWLDMCLYFVHSARITGIYAAQIDGT